METPVKTNFKDGLNVFEYFISTSGARKGQADTALKTANSGYLTRRLVDVAQDLVITTEDCGTLGYINLEALQESGDVIVSLASRLFGRVLAADVKNRVTGQILLKQGHVVTRKDILEIEDAPISKVAVRSGLTCQAKRGICAACYGYDLSRGQEGRYRCHSWYYCRAIDWRARYSVDYENVPYRWYREWCGRAK